MELALDMLLQEMLPAHQEELPIPEVQMILHQEVLPVPEGPHRCSRLADQSQGLYINIVEKGLMKKRREVRTGMWPGGKAHG
jgi:hypothetical protein